MSPNPSNNNPGKDMAEITADEGRTVGESGSFGRCFPLVPEPDNRNVTGLLDELLCDIYGKSDVKRKLSSATNGECSWQDSDNRHQRFRANLKQIEIKCWTKDVKILREEIAALEALVAEESNNLVKYLKRKDYLLMRREAHYDVITAVIQAISSKTRDDMKMKFSLAPGTETGFSQWLDAMKMVAQLPGGVPSEFRMKLWLQLSERHLSEQNIDWEKAEAVIFNEWTNPDDEELGVQIVKDLHRTGCSLFCGAQEQNQALLKRVLLAYARWNKNVGYCQGFNMLAALILQVMDRDEKNAVKVMIYLIEGVLPESYFANNLRGLSVDMAVFRDLLRLRLPKLSKHLEALQNDTNSGTSYEPPLTNVFTMQWFLTLFSNCLPQQTVLRVWDLVFLHGNEVLLRTALAIWGILQERIMSVESADEFYSIMGVVTREMLEFGLMDANNLIKMIVMVDPFPNELQELREKYLYNISPWAQSVQSAARKGIKLFYSDPEDQDDTEDEDKIALATAYGVFRRRESGSKEIQPMGPTLDISILKQQYAKLRQRQRQAHIIISAACSSNLPANFTSVPSVSVNHLLMGKSALVNKGRRIGPPEGSIPPPKNKTSRAIGNNKQVPKKEIPVISGETLEWKDAEKRRCSIKGEKISNKARNNINNATNITTESCNGVKKEAEPSGAQCTSPEEVVDGNHSRIRRVSESSGSSTSTELCDDDDANRLSEFDPEEEMPCVPPSQINGCADDDDRYERIKECAAILIREIEEELQKNERLRLLANPGNNNKKDAKASHSTSSHDNMIIDSSPTFSGRDTEFIKSEPEVPRNVIDNAENRIFDRSKEGVTAFKPQKDRNRRKSDLALSVIKENLEMLSKFTQKTVVKEERSEEKVAEIEEERDADVFKEGGTEKMITKWTVMREDAEKPIWNGVGEVKATTEEQVSTADQRKETAIELNAKDEFRRPITVEHKEVKLLEEEIREPVAERIERVPNKKEEIKEPISRTEVVEEEAIDRSKKIFAASERREEAAKEIIERREQVTVNDKTDSFGDHFRKDEKGEEPAGAELEPAHKPVSKVNKEVNTDITIATDAETSPVTTLETIQKKDQSKMDDFLIPFHKSPERFRPEKIGYREDGESLGQFAREDLAEKWKKESERIESKIEMSKSDWDLKMKKIAELENTTREKLNELKSKSIVHRHRSLDRFESREKRKSPIPRIEVPEEEGKRKKKISALSFDEITSRTEKLLGTNLSLDSRKWRKSFDEDESRSRSYEFYSSPTSPEYRPRKYAEYSSPKRYDISPKRKHVTAAEEDWLTITEEDGKPKTIEMPSPESRGDSSLLRSPTAFNPFPTRTLSRPKEIGVRLGMYPPSPEGNKS